MEPLDVADHLRVSLIDRLRKLAEEEGTKTAAVPPPLPVVPSLSAAEKQARWRQALPAVQAVTDAVYGRPQGSREKLAALVAGEAFVRAAMDLRDWAPRSFPAVAAVLNQQGVKTAQEGGPVSADYVGRLLAHGLIARRLQAGGMPL